jgi:hypothetical protein
MSSHGQSPLSALALSFVPIWSSAVDGLIIAYVLSMVRRWSRRSFRCSAVMEDRTPGSRTSALRWSTAVRNVPVAAADVVEWASRRIDLAVLGAFLPASFVGIYYAAQQVATLPAKLKTSFEPVLGPAITRKIAPGIGSVLQSRFGRSPTGSLQRNWESRSRLASRPRGDGTRRLSVHGGTAMLGFLLAAEVIAAAAVVSEAR